MPEQPVTLISGTRKGIGKYLVEYYVEKGHTVIGCSRTEIDWQLVATFVRKHIDDVNVLDFDDCDSKAAAMRRLRVLVAAAASGERVVAR